MDATARGTALALLVLAGSVGALTWALVEPPGDLASTAIFAADGLDLKLDGKDEVSGLIQGRDLMPGGPPVRGTLALTASGLTEGVAYDLDLEVRYEVSEGTWDHAVTRGQDLGHYLRVLDLAYAGDDLLAAPGRDALGSLDADADGSVTLAELRGGINDLPLPGLAGNPTTFDLAVQLAPGAPNTVMGDQVELTLAFQAADVRLPDLTDLGEGPVVRLELTPRRAVVPAGSTVAFVAVALNEQGLVVPNRPIVFSLENASIGSLDQTGLFRGFKVGTTNVTASLGLLKATAEVVVVAGPLAQIKVVPSHATIPTTHTLRFHALGSDAYGNARDMPAATWTSFDPELGTIGADGLFQAGSTEGIVRLNASVGAIYRQFIVTIIGLVAPANVTTPSTSSLALGNVGGANTTAHVAGFLRADANATVVMQPPEDAPVATNESVGSLERAEVLMEDDATFLSIVVETQPGSLDVTPAEVDAGLLAARLQEIPDLAPEPGLFVTVTATEDGFPVNASRLQGLLKQVNVRFRVNASYLEERALDPARPRILEFEEGVLVNDDIPGRMTAFSDGAYTYDAELTSFSSFAIAWVQLGAGVGPAPGPGGGGGPGGPAGPGPSGGSGGDGCPPRQTLTPRVTREGSEVVVRATLSGCPGSFAVLPLDQASADLRQATFRLNGWVVGAEVTARVGAGFGPGGDAPNGYLPRVYVLLSTTAPSGTVVPEALGYQLPSADLGPFAPGGSQLLQRRVEGWFPLPASQTPAPPRWEFESPLREHGHYVLTLLGEPLEPAVLRDTAPPALQAVDPAGGGCVAHPRPLLFLLFQDDGALDRTSVYGTVDGEEVLAFVTAGDALTLVPASDLAEGTHDVTAHARDRTGKAGNLDWRFTVDLTPPTVEPVAPLAGGKVPAEGPVLRLRFHDGGSGIDRASLRLLVDGRPVPAVFGDGEVAYAPSSLPPGRHTLTLEALDCAGNRVARVVPFEAAGAFPLWVVGALAVPAAGAAALVARRRWWPVVVVPPPAEATLRPLPCGGDGMPLPNPEVGPWPPPRLGGGR